LYLQSWAKTLVSLKTPTVLLLDPDRKFHAFGYEAEEKYSDLLTDEEADGWALFRRFKMALYHTEVRELIWKLVIITLIKVTFCSLQ